MNKSNKFPVIRNGLIKMISEKDLKFDFGIGENQFYNQVASSSAGTIMLRMENEPYEVLGNLRNSLGKDKEINLEILGRGAYNLNWSKIKN